ncbi:hypothetical protein BACUNI_00988 [Bacteroides uniformis ATCC 8492]|uniref:Uncharacterized protein n=1 Tax=Bacteroides uniformis (strain ATCC 8492 / DSM 6597 / CCUG 4942 / CIP 103695 / JCM 5828 / KCTC 5204 / NCTC 13054 / VPI 0061) TaxID=411479 RepID=A0ABC9NFE5_BACUC|nr:hypothetical protein BACUNI_00988 [Bacteroides uniformis ATCC 8492]
MTLSVFKFAFLPSPLSLFSSTSLFNGIAGVGESNRKG